MNRVKLTLGKDTSLATKAGQPRIENDGNIPIGTSWT